MSATAVEAGHGAPPPVHLQLDSVSVEGYGCFGARVEYPLGGRGMLLLRGAHSERDAEAAAARGAATATAEEEVAAVAQGAAQGAEAVAAAEDVGAMLPTEDGGYAADDEELSASNGAGKTTLAMAALWALTGSTDARAAGKPVEVPQ